MSDIFKFTYYWYELDAKKQAGEASEEELGRLHDIEKAAFILGKDVKLEAFHQLCRGIELWLTNNAMTSDIKESKRILERVANFL